MLLLVVAVALFILVHLFPVLAQGPRARMVAALGVLPYKAVFGVAALATIVFIVKAWPGAAAAGSLYAAPSWGWHVTPLFTLAAFILFVAGRLPTNLKRIFRHPQLAAVKFWAFGHLFSNGEWRSIVLFGGLLAWGVLGMILANRRDGARVKPAPVSKAATTVSTLVGVGLYLLFALKLHVLLFGVSPFPS